VIVESFDPLDPTGNVTIRWDIMSWTSDGYLVTSDHSIIICMDSMFMNMKRSPEECKNHAQTDQLC